MMMRFTLTLMLIPTIAFAQTITRKGDKYGLTDIDGTVVLEPVYDLIKGSPFMKEVFIAKKDNKYAYMVRENSFTRHIRMDNWIQSEDYIDSVRWKKSAFEFDEIYVLDKIKNYSQPENEKYVYMGRNCTEYRKEYYVLGYSKNQRHGFITIDNLMRRIWDTVEPNSNVQNDSIKFSLENTTVHEAKYDGIAGNETKTGYAVVEQKIITLEKDKLGIVDFAYDLEVTPQYDTIPVFDGSRVYYDKDHQYAFGRKYYKVEKNGLWGLFYYEKNKVTQVIDCQCNELKSVSGDAGEKYFCTDTRNQVVLFDVGRDAQLNDKRFMFPVEWNGAPIKSDISSGFSIKVVKFGAQEKSFALIERDSLKHDYWRDHNELYLVDIANKKVIAYNQPGAHYHVFEARKNSVMVKVTAAGDKTNYEFYNIETGELKHSFQLKNNVSEREELYSDPYSSNDERDDNYIYGEIKYREKGGSEKTLGYYNFNTQTFSKAKPPKYKER